MRGTSPDFDAAVIKSHAAISQVDVIQNGKVIRQLAVHSGTVKADRTAAQQRSFEVEVSDPTGDLTPNGISALLAPFGTRLQIYRGIRIENVATVTALYNTTGAWTTVTPFGQQNGTVGDPSTGSLRLGP